jgi:hypothetical protein
MSPCFSTNCDRPGATGGRISATGAGAKFSGMAGSLEGEPNSNVILASWTGLRVHYSFGSERAWIKQTS